MDAGFGHEIARVVGGAIIVGAVVMLGVGVLIGWAIS